MFQYANEMLHNRFVGFKLAHRTPFTMCHRQIATQNLKTATVQLKSKSFLQVLLHRKHSIYPMSHCKMLHKLLELLLKSKMFSSFCHTQKKDDNQTQLVSHMGHFGKLKFSVDLKTTDKNTQFKDFKSEVKEIIFSWKKQYA